MAESGNGPHKNWTVLSLIEWGTQYLAGNGFDEARLHVELLLGRVLSLPRLSLYLQFDRVLAPAELSLFKELFKRRLAHEPLQYILGETEFMGLRIAVDPSVLIPRPETEILVEKAIECAKSRSDGSVDILDVGTGSGNIAVALSRFLPSSRILSVDASSEALAMAERNIRQHGCQNVQLRQLDILMEDPRNQLFDLIVSNPPYVSADEFGQLQVEVRDFEPRRATTDGGDGYVFHRRLAQMGMSHLRPGGWLLVEIGFGQSERVRDLFRSAGLAGVDIVPDFSQIARIAVARKPGSAEREGK
jgi:release factor glutamine methyltransferase